uniref:SET domain-containing protein n=1 Tax=Alexandrium catenella TaxID=2925 RepID=A0A7S1QSM9_ALECA
MHRVLLENCPDEVCESEVDLGKFVRSRLCLVTRWCGGGVRSVGTGSLVPVFDLFNHASGQRPGVEWSWDEEGDGMVMKATKAHEAGEELFISYGPHSNAVLYGTYGFTQPPDVEPHWSYWLSPNQLHKFEEELLSLSGGSLRGQQIFLYSNHADPTLQAVLTTVAEGGGDRPSFLRAICERCLTPFAADASLQKVLEALTRSRALAPRSAAWWAALGAEDQALANSEAVRVKMAGYLCLVVHLEVLDLVAGTLPEESCLAPATDLREGLEKALRGEPDLNGQPH